MLTPWKKAMTNLGSVLKSRDITLLTKVCIVKAMICPVLMYGSDSWTKKKAKLWRIDAFELWCWRRLLRVPWTTRSNQSILRNQPWIFIGRTDAESEAPILSSPDEKSWLLGKNLNAGKDWGQEEKRMMEDEMLDRKFWEIVKDSEAWDAAVHRVTKN